MSIDFLIRADEDVQKKVHEELDSPTLYQYPYMTWLIFSTNTIVGSWHDSYGLQLGGGGGADEEVQRKVHEELDPPTHHYSYMTWLISSYKRLL